MGAVQYWGPKQGPEIRVLPHIPDSGGPGFSGPEFQGAGLLDSTASAVEPGVRM